LRTPKSQLAHVVVVFEVDRESCEKECNTNLSSQRKFFLHVALIIITTIDL